ncbi:MAG: hypothetical protein GY842_11315 [bacterium]|nr:hypothetical protein [bacterium]
MTPEDRQTATAPVFKRCPRCDYSLRGLPPNHACPECGLRYDQGCALYRVTNPKAVIGIWLCIFGGSWMNLRHLPTLGAWASASAWEQFISITALLGLICMIIFAWFLYRRYQRGMCVAVASDGLILRLLGFGDDLIPWSEIGDVSVKARPAEKPQIALVFLRSKGKSVEIGGTSNVFPQPADVERFVEQVRERTGSARRQP